MLSSERILWGVSTTVQWVKNLTAAVQVATAAQVATVMRVQSLAWRRGLKDPTLLQLHHSQSFSLAQELPYAAGMAIKKKKKSSLDKFQTLIEHLDLNCIVYPCFYLYCVLVLALF